MSTVPPDQPVITSVPIYPIDHFKKYALAGQAYWLTVPVATIGHPLMLNHYKIPIEASSSITRTEDIFPTDVYIAVLPGVELPKVFLARSPHSGCPLEWRSDSKIYKAYCDGSEFKLDGTYLSGPSPRNLDEFSVSIREGMIWITNTVTLGKPAVSIPN